MKKILLFVFVYTISFVAFAQIEVVDENYGVNETKKIVLPIFPYDSLRPLEQSKITTNIDNTWHYVDVLQDIIGQQIYIPKGVNIRICQTRLTKIPIKDVLSITDINTIKLGSVLTTSGWEGPKLLDLYPESEFWTYLYKPDWSTLSYPSVRNTYSNSSVVGNKYYTIIDYGIHDEIYDLSSQKEKELHTLEDTIGLMKYYQNKRGLGLSNYFYDWEYTEDEEIEIKSNPIYWNREVQETLSSSDRREIQSIIQVTPKKASQAYMGIKNLGLILVVKDNETGDTCLIQESEKIVPVGFFVKAKELLEGKTFVLSYLYESKDTYNKFSDYPMRTYVLDSIKDDEIYIDHLTKNKILIKPDSKWFCDKVGLHPDGGSTIFAFLKNGNNTLCIAVKTLVPEKFLYSDFECIQIGKFVREEDIAIYNEYQEYKFYAEIEKKRQEKELLIKERQIELDENEKEYKLKQQIHLQNMINKYGVLNGTKIANREIDIGFTKGMCIDALSNYYTIVYRSSDSEILKFHRNLFLHFENGILIEIIKN